MQRRPGGRRAQRLETVPAHPAEEALDTGMALHVGRTPFGHRPSREVVVWLQAVLTLERRAQRGQRAVRLERLVHRVPFRMDLVDGDVQVQVVGVAMHRAHALVVAVTQARAQARLDRGQRLSAGCFPSSKAHQQVKRLVPAGPGVLPLRGQHFADHRLQARRRAVRRGDLAEPVRRVLLVGDVRRQSGEIAAGKRAHRHMLGDHGRPPGVLAAKRLIAAPAA